MSKPFGKLRMKKREKRRLKLKPKDVHEKSASKKRNFTSHTNR